MCWYLSLIMIFKFNSSVDSTSVTVSALRVDVSFPANLDAASPATQWTSSKDVVTIKRIQILITKHLLQIRELLYQTCKKKRIKILWKNEKCYLHHQFISELEKYKNVIFFTFWTCQICIFIKLYFLIYQEIKIPEAWKHLEILLC